jgi:glycosyltransferase involved in cell wall biosynthesis
VVFYAPWATSRVSQTASAEFQAGGAETQLLLVARALARRGARVAMIVVGRPSELPAAIDGVRILPQAPRGRTGGIRPRATLALRSFRAIAGARAAVVVQRNAGATTAVAALAARLTGARFVYSSSNVVDFDLARVEPPHAVRLFEWAMRAADQVVVQTHEQAELCRARFGREPVVIPSIAEPAERRHAVPEAFLWIGRMAAAKRLGVYLDLAAAVPEARFEVVAVPGPDEEPGLAERLARAREELPNLVVHGPRPRAAMGALIDRAVAVVSTSEPGYEGMPNVFLEGWSRGVPALVFSHDPDGVVASRGLGAFAGGSQERFQAQTRELWESRADQGEMAARCLAYVREEHDGERVAERWSSQLALTASTVARHASQTASPP